MQPLRQYLGETSAQIEGWCDPFLWQALQPLHQLQKKRGISAPVAEIGVHRGKCLIGLILMTNAAEGNLAVDVFDMQEFNLDKSGKGNLEAFKKNLRLCDIPQQAVNILRADSLALQEREMHAVRPSSGGFSFFSVDGCHLVLHTMHDVRTAMELTLPQGIILVDDYYNPVWPGVHEGIARLYLLDQPKFVPLAYSCKKLFLCHVSYHAQYLKALTEFMQRHHPDTGLWFAKRYGYDTLTLAPNAVTGNLLVDMTADDSELLRAAAE